jgi:hypothetical protein
MSESHPITRVTEEDIGALGPVQLVEVTHRLLLCEARRLGLERPNIYSTTRITVPDGGRDLGWENPLRESVAYIPRPKTFYQCKASDLNESVIRGELLNSAGSELKPRVAEVLLNGGAYVFVTTSSWIRRSEALDITSVATSILASIGTTFPPESSVEVLGREKLSEWVNRYPSVIATVLRLTGRFPDMHLFDVETWGRTRELDGEYAINERLTELRERLRNEVLARSGTIGRLTGLSGLGKTRLAYEAVRRHGDDDPLGDLIQASTAYFNYGDHPSRAMNLLLGLASAGFEGVIIVDDCPPEAHRRIRDRVTSERLTILTLYHEPEPPGDHSFVITPDDNKDVVLEILKKDSRSEIYAARELKRIADFGEGFPSIARMMLDQSVVPTDRLLNEDDLAIRLLGDGGDRVLEKEEVFGAYSLFRRLGGDENTLRKQTGFVETAFLGNLSSTARAHHRASLERRGLLKRLGDVLLPAPRPLAVAFAVRMVENLDEGSWLDLLRRIEEAGLLRSFCQRISEIEFSEKREQIGVILSRIYPLREHENLCTPVGGSLFRVVALLNPTQALACAHAALGTNAPSISDLAGEWSEVTRGLEIVAWHERSFEAAAKLILHIAASGHYSSHGATVAFTGFYHLALSGTKKPAMQRLSVIRDALAGGNENERRIAILALGAGLNHHHFSRSGDASLTGTRDPEKDWYPATYSEVTEYHGAVFRILANLALGTENDEIRAFEALERGIGAIAGNPILINELDDLFLRLAESKSHLWPGARDQIRFKLDTRHQPPSAEHRTSLDRWLQYLTPPPEDFASRYQDLVASAGHRYVDDENGNPVDVSEIAALAFAEESIESGINLTPYVDVFLTGTQDKGFTFAEQIARSQPEIDALVDALLIRWPLLSQDNRNPTFIAGTIRGLSAAPERRRAILERIANTPEIRELLLNATTSGPLEIGDVTRIRTALVAHSVDPAGFNRLGLGRMTEGLDPGEYREELNLILEGRPELAEAILHVLSMYCYQRPDLFTATAPLFKKLVLHPNFHQLNVRDRHDWKNAAIRLVMLETNEMWYRELAVAILRVIGSKELFYSGGEYGEVLTLMLRRSMETVTAAISEALQDPDDRKVRRIAEFLARVNAWTDESGSLLWELGPEAFRNWLRQHPRLMPVLLHHMPLFIRIRADAEDGGIILPLEEPPRPNEYQWHPHTLILLEEGVTVGEITSNIGMNLLTFGSNGSQVPYLEERKRIVEDLTNSENPRLVQVARELIEIIDREIERERRAEINHNAEYM